MKNLTAKDIMNSNVITIRDHCTIQELASLLVEHNISGVPVINEESRYIGVVSHTDITRHENQHGNFEKDSNADYHQEIWDSKLNDEHLSQLRIIEENTTSVNDIMTPVTFQISENTPVSKIADEMLAGRVHRLIVTENKKITGIVTTMDMLKVIKECNA